MKRALITGITGQDGAYLTRFLLQRGYEIAGTLRDPVAPDTANLRALGVLDRVCFHSVDLTDQAGLIRLLQDTEPDEVYNLAAQSSVAHSFEQPTSTLQFNTLSAAYLLEALRLLGSTARFYQASSSEMYGRVAALPVTERSVLHPVSPYAISKAAAHWTAVNYREAYGLFSCCGILFNHESVLRPPRFVTKKIVRAAVEFSQGRTEPLRVGNLDVARDWGYAPEYVKCMWLMLQQERPDDYVIATGEAHTLREFVRLAFECVGLDYRAHVEVDPALYRPAEIDRLYGDPSKARRELGWGYDLRFADLVHLLIREEEAMGAPQDAPRAAAISADSR